MLDPNTHVVVVYDEHRGTYLGSRESQKIATHARCMNTTVTGQGMDCLENDYLLSSEDTAMRKPLNSWSSCIFHMC